MNLNDYQAQAMQTAANRDSWQYITYPALKLAGEAGEVAEKVGKRMRGDAGLQDLREFRYEIVRELGDVLWYVAAIADQMGTNLSVVAEENLLKLADRAERGVLRGSGDDR